ncbi:MAG: MG2 domain-containing protein [Bacteroidota bacterium]
MTQTSSGFFSKLKLKHYALGIIVLAVIVLGIFQLTGESQASRKTLSAIDPAFSAYISSYTAGVVSSESTFRVRLAQDIQDSSLIGKTVDQRLFKFSPSISGKTTFLDARTIEFEPEARLQSGQQYKVKFYLDKVLDVPDGLSVFEYTMQTVAQNFDLLVENVKAYDNKDLKRQQMVGAVMTADVAENEKVEKLLIADQEGEALEVKWQHSSDGKRHEFVVENITRREQASKVTLQLTGSAIGVNREQEQDVEIPALGDFKLIDSRLVQSPDQYVVLQFSDPLKEKQNLNGLIRIGTLRSLDFKIQDNQIFVYPSVRQTGEKTITISSGIKNVLDYKMNDGTSVQIRFEQIKPAVRLANDKGNILPSTEGLIFPFEAVSLKAVDVEIIKIYEENIVQFLQVNTFENDRQIRRVGRPVMRKTIQLGSTGVTDLSKWNRYTLDLAELINAEPGALYQVRLSFRKQHSAYFCGESVEEEQMVELDDNFSSDAQWDAPGGNYYYDDYYYEDYYYDDYNWNEREDPCTSSYFYYASNYQKIKKNIIASDLGLIAKRGNNGESFVAVTDIRTTEPLSGIAIEMYDYQQQLIGSAITDGEGIAELTPTRSPFVVVAKNGAQRGYLKMDDGSSLSLSNFDVAGERVEKGLKGFIYGERGVWRPGDSLHITFVLEDKAKVLPESHPVIFELFNSRGQLEEKIVKSTSVGGFYNFSTKTDSEAPTGNWSAKVRVGGIQFNKQLKIETVKPNRLKINLDFGKDKLIAGDENVRGDLEVKWLHGAPARNLKAEFEVILSEAPTKFSGFDNYTFDDPSREFYTDYQQIFEGYLDDNGKASVNANLNVDDAAPGKLNALFKGKVFEEGGNFSVDRFSIPYYPYSSFVGVKLPESKSWSKLFYNKTNSIDIATVDAEGNAISKRGVEVEVYELQWRWWWNRDGESIANYISRSSVRPVKRGTVNTTNGKASWDFDLPDWGRYYIRVCDPSSNHCTGLIEYTSWGGSRFDVPGGASMLTFSADKDTYEVGEQVNVTIPSSDQGRALVTVENGSEVLQHFWVQTQAGETPFSFEVTPEMAPNVYIGVSLLQQHAQTANDLPIRLYGVIPIRVDDQNTHLQPKLEMDDVLEPGQEVVIKVSEESRKKMSYTVAVVDEGLLDLTRFKTPDAWAKFYAREALGVKTWDIYDHVIGAFGGNIERLLAIGGGGDLEGEENSKANRFKPVVTYLGPFSLDAGETATHKFTMPQYIGSVRTMVVAGNEGAYGKAEKATPVRQSLMVLGTLPRVLGPDEMVKLPVTVFAQDNSIRNVKIEVKSNDLINIQGSKSKSITFNKPGDQVVDFDLKVKPTLGIAKVEIIATSGSETATHEIELDVRNPNPFVTDVKESIVQGGSTWNTAYTPVGMSGTNSGVLEVSNIPPLNLGERLRYLLRYPHGCVEQTTSSVFPQLFLADIVELTDEEKAKIETNIKAGIERLKLFQVNDGGFAYWPGYENADSWGSNYAGHFLIEAKNRGYYVPGDVIRKWKRYQRRKASSWRKSNKYYRSDLIQAYRLYTLALAGNAESGAMNRLREESGLSQQAKWRLAAAYAQAGQPEAAKNLIENATTVVKDYTEMSYSYGSSLRDEAMILETLSLLQEQVKGAELMKKISAKLNQNNWYSTQTTAYCLIAISKFAGAGDRSGDFKFTYQIDGGGKIEASTELSVVQIPVEIKDASAGNISLTNDTGGILFARLILEGQPSRGQDNSSESNLKLNMTYTDMDGQIINPSNLAQGTDFMVQVTVSNPGLRGNYEELAITQIFPSGWEIVNTRFEGTENVFNADTPEYQDIRDDRVYTYFDLRANERKTFNILLNATYAGDYYLPAVSCEAMYDNTVGARVAGQDVKVVKSSGGGVQ